MTPPLAKPPPHIFHLPPCSCPPPPSPPTPGWANRCSAFQALSQVSADLAAPRNGPSGPAAARTLPHAELLKAPGASCSLGEVRTGVRRAEGTGEPCRSRLCPPASFGIESRAPIVVGGGERAVYRPLLRSFTRGWQFCFSAPLSPESLHGRQDSISRLLASGENGGREWTFPR